MIGMTFQSFVSLLLISAVCASIVHSMLRLTVLYRSEAYLAEWIIGWLGAWIGSSVVGHWGWMIPGSDVYLVPAALASIASIYLMAASFKSMEMLLMPMEPSEKPALSEAKTRVALVK